MINRKKCLAVLLVLVVLCPYLLVPSFAAETVLRIHAPGGLTAAGEDFVVEVEIIGNPGVNSIQLTLEFDHSVMACKRIERGSAVAEMLFADNPEARNGAKISLANAYDLDEDGTIALFSFTALQDVDNYDFSLDGSRMWNSDVDEINYRVELVHETVSTESLPPQETPNVEQSAVPTPVETETPLETPQETFVPAPGVIVEPEPTPTETVEETDVPEAYESESPVGTDEPIASPIISPTSPVDTIQPQSSPELTNEPIQPTEPILVESPTPTDVVLPTFVDTIGHWGETYIGRAVVMGLFKGYGNDYFGPDDDVTRAQFVTVLYRHAGSPEVVSAVPFSDIDDQIEEFQKAISWAYSEGYINGRTESVFDPSGSLTRQEAMKILFGYAGSQSGMESLFTQIYNDGFEDSGLIAEWAKPAMYWAYYNTIINGTSGTKLSPTGTATRAQLAKILVNYIELFESN